VRIDPLDAHDRLLDFTQKEFDIAECCQDLINKKPFGDHPFYIFAHARTDDDGVTKRLIWQPRLTRPSPQTNSMLFKGFPGTDIVHIIWMIPAREMWDQYQKGKLTQNETICQSIHDFQHNRERLETRDPEDLSDAEIAAVYQEMKLSMQYRKI
jgi:hypothetical protein